MAETNGTAATAAPAPPTTTLAAVVRKRRLSLSTVLLIRWHPQHLIDKITDYNQNIIAVRAKTTKGS